MITKEIRPALTMTHRTREECEQHKYTRLWVQWAERFGFAWHVGQRHYYNLPGPGLTEGFDDDNNTTSGLYYWELHIQADVSAEVPSDRAAMVAASVDSMIQRHRDILAGEAAYTQEAIDEIRAAAPQLAAAYREEKQFPRNDDNYRYECLSKAIWKAMPGSKAANSLSASRLSFRQVFEIAGITD